MDFSRPGLEFKSDGIEVFLIKDGEWAVPGFKDTLLRCFLELEVLDGTAQEFFEGVQAWGGQGQGGIPGHRH